MAFATPSQKEEIRHRVPLEDVAREYNIVLTASGRRLKGLCPFHAEKTPSFTIDMEKQFFYCFGCREKGDLFDFVQKMERLEFVDALELLARRAGVTLERGGRGRSEERVTGLHDALSKAADFYHQFLLRDPAAAPAREYLARRGIEVGMWERFRLGFSPADGRSLIETALREGTSLEALESAGLARRPERASGRPYDVFRGRLMFPILDPRGRGIGFGARTLGDDTPKYINTPRTALFDKSQVLYGLWEARRGIQREGLIGIVEGYTDVILAHQAGLDFMVASLGTAFTAENARRLARLAPRVVLVFDGDAAGQKASERSLDLLVDQDLDVRVYTVTSGKDPAEAILSVGGDEFRRRIGAESVGLFEYKWQRTVGSGQAAALGASLRARAMDEFLDLVSKVPNVVARKLHLREFAEKLGIPEQALDQRLAELSRKRIKGKSLRGGSLPGELAGTHLSPEGGADTEVLARRHGEEVEAIVAECLLALPHRAQEMLARVPDGFFRNPALRTLVHTIERQLAGGGLSVDRLIRETEDPQVHSQILEILSRIETADGAPSRDYEDVWRFAERDIERSSLRRRLEELDASKAALCAQGNQEASRERQREFFQIMRDMKRARKN
jgi:DNA primase